MSRRSRLAVYPLTLGVAVTLDFLLPRLMPGDPADLVFARFQGRLTPEAIEAMRAAWGLDDRPWPAQYADYLAGILRGDLGVSLSHFPAPVADVVWQGLGWSALLGATATTAAFVIGTAIGAWSARFRGGLVDAVAPPALVLLGAFPYFWLAMAAVWVFGVSLGWTPTHGAWDPGLSPALTPTFFASLARHAALPGLTLVAATTGGWVLTMRTQTLAELDQEHVRHAVARGLAPGRIMLGHVVRSAIVPGLTSFGTALGYVVSGSLLTEMVFGWPGQGMLLLEAVRSQDLPLMQGLFLTITVATLAANAAVDLALLALDPRSHA
ncbi:MAG TPA: ABC transporter permease [Myxococcota bacterium]|nr:ABC transporter permease [Myxococcota bacterium]